MCHKSKHNFVKNMEAISGLLNAKRMIRIFSLTALFTVTLLCMASFQRSNPAAASSRVLYVATNGNDQWSGTLPSPASSGNDGPFATLHKARNTIRELKKKEPDTHFTVQVRGGVYYLHEPLVLGPEDSGTEAKPLIFQAFGDENPVLRGTIRITNFKPYKGSIHQADISPKQDKINDVRQLFAEGIRQIPARHPNVDKLNPVSGGFLYVADSGRAESKVSFSFLKGTLPGYSLENAELVIHPGKNWTNNIREVGDVDRNANVLTLAEAATHEIKPGNRYYFQNILAALDSPGEWYLDKQQQRLFFWPTDKTVLQSTEIPVLDDIVLIKGDTKTGGPAHIHFKGFTLEGCNGNAISVINAQSVLIAGCTIRHTGKHGIEISDGMGNRAVGNDIHHTGGRGIMISGGEPETLTPAGHRAENNYVHHVGNIYKNNSGIDCRGVGNIVSHNLIHSTPRAGIWFDGNDHQIEYNHVHHVNQETDDCGIIYTSQIDWTKRGSVIQFNHLHHSGGFGRDGKTGEWRAPFNTFGIYLDDWTSGTTVYGNIVRRTTNGGILIHGGRDNRIENNIIIDGGFQGQMVYSGWIVDHPIARKWLPRMFEILQQTEISRYRDMTPIDSMEQGATMSGNHFIRNIIQYTDKQAALFGIYNHIDLATTKSDNNIIYHDGLPLRVPYMNVSSGEQWTAWLEKGFDRNSIISDPMFSDAARGDFSLSPESPALKMGFTPIPMEKIGLYQDPLRASWPPPDVYQPGNLRVLDIK